jgi:hypothetical protein
MHSRWRRFPIYPGSFPAAGLLLLRVAIGVAAIRQGWSLIPQAEGLRSNGWVAGALILSGTALATGFLSILSSSVIALAVTCSAVGWLPSPAAGLSDGPMTAGLVVVAATTIVLIGPGAISVDAWLFGFREIFIPRSHGQ